MSAQPTPTLKDTNAFRTMFGEAIRPIPGIDPLMALERLYALADAGYPAAFGALARRAREEGATDALKFYLEEGMIRDDMTSFYYAAEVVAKLTKANSFFDGQRVFNTLIALCQKNATSQVDWFDVLPNIDNLRVEYSIQPDDSPLLSANESIQLFFTRTPPFRSEIQSCGLARIALETRIGYNAALIRATYKDDAEKMIADLRNNAP